MSELQSIARQHFTERRVRGKRFMDDHERCKNILEELKIEIAKAFGIYEHSFEVSALHLDEKEMLTTTNAEDYGTINLLYGRDFRLDKDVLIRIEVKYNGRVSVSNTYLDVKDLSPYIRAVVLRSSEFLDKMFNINGGRLPGL